MTQEPPLSILNRLFRSNSTRTASRRNEWETDAWLAAMVDSSSEAILSQTPDGTIRTWNAGAETLFGYTPGEAIGQSFSLITPRERLSEGEGIIARLRGGENPEQVETVRRRTDGSLIDVMLSVSLVKDAVGNVLGTCSIARDMSAAKREAIRQDLLIREMNRRIKNLFSVTTSLVALSATSAADADELAADLIARLDALARAHALIVPDLYEGGMPQMCTTLPALLSEVTAPHKLEGEARILISGDSVPVGQRALPTLVMLFHELTTNSAKYGALATPDGRLKADVVATSGLVEVNWREAGGRTRPNTPPASQGFGSLLEQAIVAALQGTLTRTWQSHCLEIAIRLPLSCIAQ